MLERQLVRAKKMIARCVHQKDKHMIGPIEMLNQELCLVVADFKCQNPKCQTPENLQIHHLIMRRAKEFMDIWRYLSQRYYWANQVVLCQKCHRHYHKLMGKDVGEHGKCITKTTITRVKRRYKANDNRNRTGAKKVTRTDSE